MRITLCTLVLNEMQWLEKLYQQHKDFPGLLNWVFVESADKVYAETNRHLVDSKGLSIDGTSEYLEQLLDDDNRIIYIQHGLSKHNDPAQGKIESRNRYLSIIDQQQYKPDYLLVIDADEFWPYSSQEYLRDWLVSEGPSRTAFSFNHREIWYPPCYHGTDTPLFREEVVGGFWSIPYCRGWRYIDGMRYTKDHNTPSHPNGTPLTHKLKDHRRYKSRLNEKIPEFVHMGFASELKYRKAKNEYYKARGEGRTDHRGWYTESRAAWETWKPGDTLPRGARVVNYNGPIPECFMEV